MSDPTLIQPPPRRHGWRTALIVVGAIVGVCTIANLTRLAVAASLTGTPVASADAVIGSTGPAAQPATAGIGESVRDGQFEFVVRGVGCGERVITNGWLRATAKGQYCVVDLTVRNVGTQARRFADGLQQGIGAQGQRYDVDTGAGVVANGSGDAVWDVVNPGVSLNVKIV